MAIIHFSKWRLIKIVLALTVLLVVTLGLASLVGVESISLKKAFFDSQSVEHAILFYSRLPRILLGAMVGMALSACGVSFQCLLRNPLADPFILGVSGGAALGSVLGISLGWSLPWISLLSFLSSFFSMMLIYWIATTEGRLPVYTLLLTGVIYNSFTFAVIMLINSLVSFENAHRIWYLMVGGLAGESYFNIALVSGIVVFGVLLLFFQTGQMNILALGEETSAYLGCDPHRVRRNIFFAASLIIGACVSVSGLIGFVGLFIPHLMRLWMGSDHRILLPASALFGATFLVIADTGARSLFAGETYSTQLPVGVITALLGGPFFVYLLKRRKKFKL